MDTILSTEDFLCQHWKFAFKWLVSTEMLAIERTVLTEGYVRHMCGPHLHFHCMRTKCVRWSARVLCGPGLRSRMQNVNGELWWRTLYTSKNVGEKRFISTKALVKNALYYQKRWHKSALVQQKRWRKAFYVDKSFSEKCFYTSYNVKEKRFMPAKRVSEKRFISSQLMVTLLAICAEYILSYLAHCESIVYLFFVGV